MFHSFKAFCLAAGIAAVSTTGASAALLDFTAGLPGATSGSIGTVDWDLSAEGGDLNTSTRYDGGDDFKNGPNNPGLTLRNDGVGIGDDEVTGAGEVLILNFSQAIILQAVHFLDLFTSNNGTEAVFAFNAATNSLLVTAVASDSLNGPLTKPGYGFKQLDTETAVKTIRFVPGGTADNNNTDFALAAIEYRSSDGLEPDPVPLPAGALLLLGGLGGLAAVRRRKKS